MLVMPDIEDVYSLNSASVVVPLQESHHLVGCMSGKAPMSGTNTNQCCLQTMLCMAQDKTPAGVRLYSC